ncbi:ABC transporter substrate-binding protein [Paraburkholderia silvatlantica]|uniref:Peptide/nickel transport system substrate-binding protein n=1 Tax=Paraburkholderia silvatlantica TaxID=321895 RepID=A0A2U1AC51_9BURK|nr:ABC transporter substrate-binding protein [Paraburkholderia silvatlantica]MBB2925748.1 peptide/nickel transport system substrate-binding protein [Paraburkholderia silvatlantica]PVY33136.1 peptide/nickel transport system substrate-binding protein [Paraburkholderia silvatlantica]PXW38028.1 peptide/nickel transport system substrate-binding protein [Paraburkholderia silvatlantica]PYE28004.1 peptide/nickel transport system substrate-binding protein [Paraburkholderia silvatlantica]TDQ92557.1 pept
MKTSRRDFLSMFAAAGVASALPGIAAADEAPRKGGNVRMAVQNGSVSDTLDPAKGAHSGDWTKQFCVFNALTEFNGTLSASNALADKLESTDGSNWHIVLKQGVHFHDGAEMTSEDVVYSLARHKDPANASKAFAIASEFKEIKAAGKYEVALVLERPNFDLPSVLGSSYFLIVKNNTKDFAKPAGTGPFIVDSFTPGGKFAAKRNPNYWKSGLPYLDTVEIIGVPDNAARVNAVLAGDIDICSLVDHRYAAQVKGHQNVQLVANKLGIYTDLILRQDNPITGNADFVSAVRYLQDRKRMVSDVMQTYGVIANDHPVAPWDPYFLEGLPQRQFDLDKAKFHIKKSGCAGQSMEIFCQPGIASSVEGAQFLQSFGAQAGFNFVVRQVPTDGYWSTYWTKRPITYGSISNRPNVGMIFELFYSSKSPTNEARWKDPKLDQLLDSARAEGDFNKRKAIYGDMQTLVHDSSGTVVPVFDVILDGVSKKVRGYKSNPSGMNMGYRFAEAVWRA